MDNHPFPVQWEVSLDPEFKNVVKRGTELSKPQLGHSVHVEVDGLEPSLGIITNLKPVLISVRSVEPRPLLPIIVR